MNYFRLGLNLLTARLTGKNIPFQLNMHITDVCNLRCTYCYVDFERNGGRAEVYRNKAFVIYRLSGLYG